MKASDAARELAEQLSVLGVAARATGDHVRIASPEATFRVKTASVLRRRPQGAEPAVVVADAISGPLREELTSAGIGWLDRRGHLRLTAPGLFVDTDIASLSRPSDRRRVDPMSGPVIAAVAVSALAAFPEPIGGVRELARRFEVTPGGVSLAVRRLKQGGLLTDSGVAAVPGLFNAMADGWGSSPKHRLGRMPIPTVGLVVTGGHAAAALGAPVVVSRSQPVELLAESEAVLRAALRRTAPTDTATPAAIVSLAPSPAAATPFGGVRARGFAIVHPAVAALALAQDRARGPEILDDWKRDERVW